MRLIIKDYNGGLNAVPEEVKTELQTKLEEIEMEKGRVEGKYIRLEILNRIVEIGWSDRVSICPDSRISITAANRKVGLCVQFGNMARFYADLLKLQALFEQGKITSAIYIIPTKSLAKKLLANMANFERMVQELEFYSSAINIPIVIFGVDGVVNNG